MKQIVFTRAGGPEVLQVQERKDPEPGKGQVKIRVRASGINFADLLARRGIYPEAPKKPCVVGFEVAGVVESLGEGVDPSLLGKEVFAVPWFGGYADVVVVPVFQTFIKPEALGFEQAAAFPVAYLTAYALTVAMGALQKTESVLIHNAGGGVGLAALDIAKHIGAQTIGTASTHKHDFLKKKGLDYAIDYTRQDWLEEVKRITNGRGVELVIDPIGGKNLKKSYRALRRTGRLGTFGISLATRAQRSAKLNLIRAVLQTPKFSPIRLMNANKGIFGVHVGHLWDEADKVRAWAKRLLKGIEEGWVNPHVDRTFLFEEAAEAHRYIEERKNMGKVILVPWDK
jgi:NADPH:quinone reductase-like Zn-dependent oxidoreductase